MEHLAEVYLVSFVTKLPKRDEFIVLLLVLNLLLVDILLFGKHPLMGDRHFRP